MKKPLLKPCLQRAILTAALMSLSGPAVADTNYISRFDSANEADAWSFDFGGVTHTNFFDPTMDGDTNSNSGALKIITGFNTNLIATGDNKGAYSIALSTPISGNDVLNLDSIHMDIKVDPNSTTDNTNFCAGCDGLSGYFALVFRTGDTWFWAPQFSDNIGANYQVDSNGWRHIYWPITLQNTDPVHHITIQIWGNDAQHLDGPVTLWIDNVYYTTFTTTTSAPPTLTLNRAVGGVNIAATVLGGTYQRQDIRTSAGTYTWINPTNGSVTYSFTLTNFPSGPTNGFEARMMLVGNHSSPGAFADYNESNVVYLRVGSVYDTNTQTTHYDEELRYKVNAGNSNIYDTNFVLNPIAVIRALPSPLGTWGITVSGTNVTMFSPFGFTNGAFGSDVFTSFNNSTYAYIGIVPNNDLNVGQSATFSAVSISGATTALDEHFRLLNRWFVGVAQDATGVLLQPSNTFAKISWPPPPSPVLSVHATNSLAGSGGSWPASGLAINTVGTNKVVLLTGPTNSTRYFRLESP